MIRKFLSLFRRPKKAPIVRNGLTQAQLNAFWSSVYDGDSPEDAVKRFKEASKA
jgi:hypothetical protein